MVAAPGGGKSALAVYMLLRMAYEHSGVPALYYCADSDMLTVAATAMAPILDVPIEQAEYLIASGDRRTLSLLEQATKHIWFCFKRGPGLDDIETEMHAYAHVHGEYPHILVVDNLKNISEHGEEVTRYNMIMPALQEMSGVCNAHVMVLHHVTGAYSNGDKPIPRDGIKYKVDDVAGLTLSLFKPEEGFMGVRVLKSRSGRADATAGLGVDIAWESSRGWFAE